MVPAWVDASVLTALRAATPVMVEQLADLVNAESPSDAPDAVAACADLVAALGAGLLGQPADRVEVGGRVHLRWRLGNPDSPPVVVLIGHFDTVWPAGTLARWPFAVDSGTRATGPGAFDMKAGIVQMFHALAALRPPLDGIAVVLTSDEELGSPTSRALIEDTARGASAALVLEPSADGGALKVARKGTSMYELHVAGRAAHAGLEPEKGVNATVELAHQVLAVAALGRPEEGTTVTPTVAAAGTTTNTVPATAVCHIDARASTVAEQQRVDAALHDLAPVVAGTRLRLEGGPNRPPFDRDASAGLWERARKLAANLGIDPPDGVAVGGGSDGNFTAGLGVPTLDGLGAVGAGAHAEGEYVVVDAMAERAALLAALVADLLDDAAAGGRTG